MVRLVVTDLDGTFWDSDLQVPPSHLDAASALRDRNVEVAVATSRRHRVVAKYLGQAGLLAPAVVLDGALGIDLRDGTRFHDASFSVTSAVDVLRSFRAHGLEPCIYVDEQEYDVVLPAVPSTCAAHVDYLGSLARVGELDGTVTSTRVYGFSVIGLPHRDLVDVATALSAVGAEAHMFREQSFGGWGVVVAPPLVTKWAGVSAYCRSRGVAAADVLAVGDGDNDVDMLQRAGIGVAVRGGTERAVAAADHLIEPPEDNGWSAILELIDEQPAPSHALIRPRPVGEDEPSNS